MHGIGIIGAGSIAGAHLRAAAALESTQVRAVADTRAEARDRVCAEHRCRGYSTYQELLADDRVDVAIVCLPHALHCEADRGRPGGGQARARGEADGRRRRAVRRHDRRRPPVGPAAHRGPHAPLLASRTGP